MSRYRMSMSEPQRIRIASMATETVRDKVPLEVPSADYVFISERDLIIIMPVNAVELLAGQAEGR